MGSEWGRGFWGAGFAERSCPVLASRVSKGAAGSGGVLGDVNRRGMAKAGDRACKSVGDGLRMEYTVELSSSRSLLALSDRAMRLPFWSARGVGVGESEEALVWVNEHRSG